GSAAPGDAATGRAAAAGIAAADAVGDAVGDGVRDTAARLRERMHPRRCRVAVTQAPMMRLVASWDEANHRWLAVWLVHHLVGDIASSNLLAQEIEAHLAGETAQLSPALPFREFVGY